MSLSAGTHAPRTLPARPARDVRRRKRTGPCGHQRDFITLSSSSSTVWLSAKSSAKVTLIGAGESPYSAAPSERTSRSMEAGRFQPMMTTFRG